MILGMVIDDEKAQSSWMLLVDNPENRIDEIHLFLFFIK